LRWHYALDGFPELTMPPVLVDGAVFYAANDIDSLAALGDVDEQD
jgi:outer membrane protein assembly factor BamB